MRAVLAVTIAAALLYGMQRTTPYFSDITSPVSVRGVQGKRVEADSFAAAIARVRLAREIVIPGFPEDRTLTSSSGIWVVVEGAAEALQQSLALASATWLSRDGIRYAMSSRTGALGGEPGTEQLQPGIPRPLLMVFEVPERQLAGATVIISPIRTTALVQEVHVALTEVPEPVHGRIIIRRGSRLLPWRLEAQ